MKTVETWFLWLMIYSIIGWVYESTICSISQRKLINRGFLNGPYCPIYGTGAVLVLLVLGRIQNPVLLFFAGAVLTCSLEYLTSWLMEKLFHARWWDYSNKKFNIQGRICLGHTFYWGIASLLFLYLVHPIVVYCFSQLLDSAAIIIFACVLAVFLVDLVFAVYRALDVRKVMDKIKGFSDTLSNFAGTIKSGVSDKVPSLDETKAKLESFKRDATAQLKDAFHFAPSSDKTDDESTEKESGRNKLKVKLNRHFTSSSNLLPYAKKQIKKLEEMYDEIRRAFFDDDDDDLY